jgi:hypothetical protein
MPGRETNKTIKPCPHCGKREVLGRDAIGRLLCMCGENYHPERITP